MPRYMGLGPGRFHGTIFPAECAGRSRGRDPLARMTRAFGRRAPPAEDSRGAVRPETANSRAKEDARCVRLLRLLSRFRCRGRQRLHVSKRRDCARWCWCLPRWSCSPSSLPSSEARQLAPTVRLCAELSSRVGQITGLSPTKADSQVPAHLQPLSTLSRTAQKRTRLTAVTSSAGGAVTTALHHFTMRPVRWCALLCLPPYCGRAPALRARRSGTRFMIASSSAAPSSLRPHANVQMV